MLAAKAILDDGRALMTPGSIEALRDHALAAYPAECVGFVDSGGIYHRLDNRAADPRQFAVPDHRLISDLIASGQIRALCHSHPGGPDCPSQMDMRTQAELDIPFVIIATNGQACAEPFAWGDQIDDQRPLIGRPFRHGVDDCYAMIRAWWRRERGVILPDFARQWEWWGRDAAEGVERDLYRRHFRDAGFYEIAPSEASEGDVWLASIRSDVPNHAGVYLSDGLALHHAALAHAFDPSRLSRRDPIARWLPYITHWLRRDNC
jgi:cell wall-associated NlpC family hydrolase